MAKIKKGRGKIMSLGIETEILEFKKSTGELKEAMHSISAILNKHQYGELYFGVKADGTVVGQTVTEESLREVSQKIGNSIEPKIYPEVKQVNIEGRDCIYVKFEGNQTPYFAFGVARIRVADEDLVMSSQELANYIRKNNKEGNRWENLISNKTIDDVDEELLKKYTNRAHEVGRIAIGYTDKRIVLNQLELSEGNALTNAGKTLFADDLLQDIQMAIFATTERLTFNDIQRYHGPVLKLVDLAENYIKSNIHWKVEFTGSLQRTEIPEIPMDAIREALLNSFCHKDYSTGQSNEVAIYRDRVEIYNPGSFPEGYNPQDFIDRSERPIRRNPKIARMLYYSKDIESFGTGLKRIADACMAVGVRYEFQKLKSGFVVCFYRENNEADKKPIKADRKPIKASREKEVIKYIRENGYITNSAARELLGLADSTTKRFLKDLVDKGILEVEGERKGRKYFLNDSQT
ncbi:MAG: putative DNA binding domain-containing protein [Lachnospiraceae bacterium]|nr:putative DNA binding domain-containing protein [Lachnospiraceae bacterium]